jgi:zinc transport system substrate-binding protein
VALETLIPAKASPHDYPLKVSDHLRLHKAALVLWVGPELESFLAKPLANLAPAQVLAAADIEGMEWPDVVQEEAHGSAHHHAHAHDPHLWLNPVNASRIAQIVAQRLGVLIPESAALFMQNAANFSQANEALDASLMRQLSGVKHQGFVVAHEGYSHFVRRYGLHQLAYVALTPERRPGARHLAAMHQSLAQEGKCVFVEVFSPSQSPLQKLAAQLQLPVQVLDPMGLDATSYTALLQTMGDSFLRCLTQ